jgi:hypothetical protein
MTARILHLLKPLRENTVRPSDGEQPSLDLSECVLRALEQGKRRDGARTLEGLGEAGVGCSLHLNESWCRLRDVG